MGNGFQSKTSASGLWWTRLSSAVLLYKAIFHQISVSQMCYKELAELQNCHSSRFHGQALLIFPQECRNWSILLHIIGRNKCLNSFSCSLTWPNTRLKEIHIFFSLTFKFWQNNKLNTTQIKKKLQFRAQNHILNIFLNFSVLKYENCHRSERRPLEKKTESRQWLVDFLYIKKLFIYTEIVLGFDSKGVMCTCIMQKPSKWQKC